MNHAGIAQRISVSHINRKISRGSGTPAGTKNIKAYAARPARCAFRNQDTDDAGFLIIEQAAGPACRKFEFVLLIRTFDSMCPGDFGGSPTVALVCCE